MCVDQVPFGLQQYSINQVVEFFIPQMVRHDSLFINSWRARWRCARIVPGAEPVKRAISSWV